MKKADKIDALKKLKAFIRSGKFGVNGRGIPDRCDGLCHAINWIGIEVEQHRYLLSRIPKHRPYEYVWREGAKAPRIKWINEQLKKLEKK